MTALPVRITRVLLADALLGWFAAALVLMRDTTEPWYLDLIHPAALRCGICGVVVGFLVAPAHAAPGARLWRAFVRGPLAMVTGMALYFTVWPPQSWTLPTYKWVGMYLADFGAVLLPLGAFTGVLAIRWAHKAPRFRIGVDPDDQPEPPTGSL
jgi:hypothetical protein